MADTHLLFSVKEHRRSEKLVEVNFLVDSGTSYSLVPGEVLDSLGIEPYKEMEFPLADGTIIKRKMCSAYIEYKGQGGPAPVVYGEQGDEAVLGSTTLEAVGMVLNPFTRKLQSVQPQLAKNIN